MLKELVLISKCIKVIKFYLTEGRYVIATVTIRASRLSSCTKDKEFWNYTDGEVIFPGQLNLENFHLTGTKNLARNQY